MRRTEKEMLLRRVGKWLGIGFRFHRLRGLQVTNGGKSRACFIGGFCADGGRRNPRYWGFQFWKKVPGNPRNCWSAWDYDKFVKKHADEIIPGRGPADKHQLKRSELMYIDVPKHFTKKDDIIDWILFESDFMRLVGGPSVQSREELDFWLETTFAQEKI